MTDNCLLNALVIKFMLISILTAIVWSHRNRRALNSRYYSTRLEYEYYENADTNAFDDEDYYSYDYFSKPVYIYNDLITGDVMFTDSSEVRLIDSCIYEVECRYVTRKQGFNPSAEDFDEGTDELIESGLDLVLNHRLVETWFSKRDYKNYLKTYTKSLRQKWRALDYSAEQIASANRKLAKAVRLVLPNLGDYQFFLGESSNPDGCVALLEYRPNEDGSRETPIMIFFSIENKFNHYNLLLLIT